MTRADAGVLVRALQSSFISFQGLWGAVLPEMDDTQKYLQRKGIDIQKCHLKIKPPQFFLIEGRAPLVKKALSYAEDVCNNLGII